MPSKRAWIVRKFGVAVRAGAVSGRLGRVGHGGRVDLRVDRSGKAKSCVIDGGNPCANKTRKSPAEAGPAGMNRVGPAWSRTKCPPVECTAFGVHGHAS